MNLPRFNDQSYAHYVTTKTDGNHPVFRDEECCRILLENIEWYRQRMGFSVIGYCVMPDHVHMIIWWDVGVHQELTISRVMQAIKSHSAKEIINYFLEGRRKPSLSPYSTASEGSRLPINYKWVNTGKVHTPVVNKIWQPSFYDFNIYSEQKLHEKLNYLHWNPVQAGLCAKPEDWTWSSHTFYKTGKAGILMIDRLVT